MGWAYDVYSRSQDLIPNNAWSPEQLQEIAWSEPGTQSESNHWILLGTAKKIKQLHEGCRLFL